MAVAFIRKRFKPSQVKLPITLKGRKFTGLELRSVVEAAVRNMSSRGAYLRDGTLAQDARSQLSNVWSDETRARSADGWLAKAAYDLLADVRGKTEVQRHRKRAELAWEILEFINDFVFYTTDGKTLVSIADDEGKDAVIAILRYVSQRW